MPLTIGLLPARPLLPTLPLQIAEQIADAIIAERYLPKEQLKETELARHFEVSRSTVREALRILETRNLVRIQPQRGAQVTGLSSSEVEDLFEIRAFLVGLVARRLATDCGEEIVGSLEALLARLRAVRHDREAYARASAATAIELAQLTQSEHLVQVMMSFAHQIGRYARLGLLEEKRRRRSIQLWEKLFQAIRRCDAQAAETLNRQLALENRDAALLVLKSRNRGQREHGRLTSENLSDYGG